MQGKILLLVGALILGVAACQSQRRQSGNEAQLVQTPKKLNVKITRTLQAEYLLFLPKDYSANVNRRWPLMLFLHGAGERGSDVSQVAKHGPPKYVQTHPDFPFILVSPQCPGGQLWSNDILIALLDEITNRYAVDPKRIYLTGLSMGGFGTWELGMTYPGRFAAIAPICGGGEAITPFLASGEKARALKTLGVWAFHGAKDPVVPLAESEHMVGLLQKLGVQDVKLTVYPEAQHDAWTETYANPELYEWFLKHSR